MYLYIHQKFWRLTIIRFPHRIVHSDSNCTGFYWPLFDNWKLIKISKFVCENVANVYLTHVI